MGDHDKTTAHKSTTGRIFVLGAVAAMAALGVVSVGLTGSAAVADADLSAGIVVDQHVFDVGASWRSYEERIDTVDDEVGACMRAQGHDYREPDQADEGGKTAFGTSRGSELAFARDWGFGLTTTQDFVTEGTDTLPPTDDRGERASEDYDRALYGDEDGPEEGCQMASMATMDANADRYFELVERVDAAKASFASHPDVVAHYADWSSCMSERGHDVASPIAASLSINDAVVAALEDNRDYFIEDKIRPREIALATDTVECGGPVRDLLDDDLADTWVEVARGAGL